MRSLWKTLFWILDSGLALDFSKTKFIDCYVNLNKAQTISLSHDDTAPVPPVAFVPAFSVMICPGQAAGPLPVMQHSEL